eukprot:m.123834 g.123834  ORF g.123834 m.123834 type:complete len:202 (+) comp16604_c0_seq2:2637-3242(+)
MATEEQLDPGCSLAPNGYELGLNNPRPVAGGHLNAPCAIIRARAPDFGYITQVALQVNVNCGAGHEVIVCELDYPAMTQGRVLRSRKIAINPEEREEQLITLEDPLPIEPGQHFGIRSSKGNKKWLYCKYSSDERNPAGDIYIQNFTPEGDTDTADVDLGGDADGDSGAAGGDKRPFFHEVHHSRRSFSISATVEAGLPPK